MQHPCQSEHRVDGKSASTSEQDRRQNDDQLRFWRAKGITDQLGPAAGLLRLDTRPRIQPVRAGHDDQQAQRGEMRQASGQQAQPAGQLATHDQPLRRLWHVVAVEQAAHLAAHFRQEALTRASRGEKYARGDVQYAKSDVDAVHARLPRASNITLMCSIRAAPPQASEWNASAMLSPSSCRDCPFCSARVTAALKRATM